MGLLDDAIREHLDLMRHRGADPAEIARIEREALGTLSEDRRKTHEFRFGADNGAGLRPNTRASAPHSAGPSQASRVDLFDQAIHQHLDLMRRHGADPAEIQRVEHSVFGPVTLGANTAEVPRQEAQDGAAALPLLGQRRHLARDQAQIAVPPRGTADSYLPAQRIAESPGTRGRRLARAAALPVLAFAVYAGVGWKEVVLQHVVNPDAISRLAHAYFVFYNSPPKLAAVGFTWPPLMTLVLLPFAVIKPMATSLLGLPLMSATFGTGLLVVLDRTLRLAGMRAALRYPLLAGFGLNPMILFYATNGMSEIVSLFFLAVALHAMLSWYLYREVRQVAVMSIALTLGFLSRYELILWLAPVVLVMFGTMLRERARLAQLGAWFIALVVPIAYGIGVWLYLNWSIMGDPLNWLKLQTSSSSATSPAPLESPIHPALVTVLERAVSVNAQLFFPTLAAIAALTIALAVRRDLMTAGLLLAITLNGMFSGLLFYLGNNPYYFQLRYNMRAIPIVIACVAWFYLMARSQRQRAMVWCVSLVALVAALPFTWQTMATSKLVYIDDAFVHSLLNFRDQTGSTAHVTGAKFRVGIDYAEDTARYIRSHISGHYAILTDDAITFEVILLDGRPDVYWDRIDKGDRAWYRALADPQGKVRYLLVGPGDRATQRYPGLVTSAHIVAGRFERIYQTPWQILFRVLPKRSKAPANHPP